MASRHNKKGPKLNRDGRGNAWMDSRSKRPKVRRARAASVRARRRDWWEDETA